MTSDRKPAPDWVHSFDDGRGPRTVTVDGTEVKRVVFADTVKGIVRFHAYPLKVKRRDGQVVERTIRGSVVVEMKQ